MDPQRGRAYTLTLTLIAQVTGAFLANPPLAAGDFQVSKDGGAFATLETLPVVAPAGSICVQVSLSAAEMDATRVVVQALDPDGIWEPVVVEIQTTVALGADARVLLSADPQPTLPADVLKLAGNTTSPAVLDRSVRSMVRGLVAAGATTTSLPTSSLIPAATVADQFKGRVLVFDDDTATAALRSQTCEVTASSSTGTLTVSPLTTAPAVGERFLLI